ncbi:Ubiquinol oxidase subunit 4 [Candidatus Johnevansia muelleri]|uniref:Cytochrome bo(3) ubiquinol oxidase subunit 4 n=1 Tax=Candidatus Johnevansia muelleri TaxID=1495769 RepID=A0A078KDR7_9GAMM|nr:Ubiquinol oxidase subunit 4 [Candidatus Evansia muelleri]
MQNENLISYINCFILSIILTIIPFYIVICSNLSSRVIYPIILIMAFIQIIIQIIYFIHLNNLPQQRWKLISLVFTCIIIFIILIGSLWIMHNLNHNII